MPSSLHKEMVPHKWQHSGQSNQLEKWLGLSGIFASNGFVQVFVRDSGIGIQKENQPRLFRLFGSHSNVMNKSSTDGIGFGLVISKMIVKQFEGNIKFKSEPDVGSEFMFSFKIAQEDEEMPIDPSRL